MKTPDGVVYMILVHSIVVVSSNVLIMVADDLGTEMELYNKSPCKTPHMKKLADRGILYENAWTAVSSCSPSRAAILTGLPPHQNGMVGLHQGYHNFQSYSTVWSLPNILKQHHARTGIIGKKHVGPKNVYNFDYKETEEENSIMQVGRNISRILELVQDFLNKEDDRAFLLYIGFHDPHRCGHTHPQYGPFCEKFGNGEKGMGYIPDWDPIDYSPGDVHVPYFVQDTPVSRTDIAAQYKTISRLDQGVGLIMHELRKRGLLDETLVIFTSDNGSPYPSGRTNVYEPGLKVPLIVSSPIDSSSWGTKTSALTSLLDITPTVLKWFDIQYPKYKIFNNDKNVKLTGQSLLNPTKKKRRYIFASHSLHEITMYYPMRSIRNKGFKLIHNLSYRMPFPIDQDFYISPVFQEIINSSLNGSLQWYKSLKSYYYRPQWELYDLKTDSWETSNKVGVTSYEDTFTRLKNKLKRWQNVTADPWICSPGSVLQDSGPFKENHKCLSLFNNL